jgi:Tol biopolymer transport system component
MRHGRSLYATISLTLLVIPLFAFGSVLLPHADDGAELSSSSSHGLHLPLVVRSHVPLGIGGTTTRVSVSTAGVQANAISWIPSISADGRYIAFESQATNLVFGDTNAANDVFVRDRVTGQTTRVSISSAGIQANGNSWRPSISADGRYVAYQSEATNLAPGDTNGKEDVFVHDRVTGQITRVSVSSAGAQANGDSGSPSISADGRYVAFHSWATNLVTGDTNSRDDIFVHDRVTGETARVSISSAGAQANSDSWSPSISADGRYIAFHSGATNLVPGDNNNAWDVFVHDRVTGETVRVSVSSGGTEANGYSDTPSISANGRYIAFKSDATNLVPGDTNGLGDILVHDRVTGETVRVSVSSGGAQATGLYGGSSRPSISADGRYVAFASGATNLVPGDTNDLEDIFVHDRVTGITARVSVSSAGAQATGDNSWWPSISADGRYVAFHSGAPNLVTGDTNLVVDVFVCDRAR